MPLQLFFSHHQVIKWAQCSTQAIIFFWIQNGDAGKIQKSPQNWVGLGSKDENLNDLTNVVYAFLKKFVNVLIYF